MKRILLAEDEESLVDVIKLNLEMESYQVVVVGNGKKAVDKFKNGRFDLIILDVMMPEMDGYSAAEMIRLHDSETPILFLTAKNSPQDRIQGLKIGDDFLAKPFNLEELLLRVKNLIKRGQIKEEFKLESEEITFGENKINFSSYEFEGVNGHKGKLSKREILLFKLLYEKNGEVVSREEILEKVWGYDVFPSTRTIDNYILVFRKYFEENPKTPTHIHSIRGVGYKLTV